MQKILTIISHICIKAGIACFLMIAGGIVSHVISYQPAQVNANGSQLVVEVPTNQRFDDLVIGESEIVFTREERKSYLKAIQLGNTYLWLGIGLLLVIAIIYAGILLITSRGDQEQFRTGMKVLFHAGIGLGIAVFSYVIINLVVNLF